MMTSGTKIRRAFGERPFVSMESSKLWLAIENFMMMCSTSFKTLHISYAAHFVHIAMNWFDNASGESSFFCTE